MFKRVLQFKENLPLYNQPWIVKDFHDVHRLMFHEISLEIHQLMDSTNYDYQRTMYYANLLQFCNDYPMFFGPGN